MESGVAGKQMTNRLTSVLRNEWFWGYYSKEQADEALKISNIGVFMVRISTTEPNKPFTISRVTTERKIVHHKINKDQQGKLWMDVLKEKFVVENGDLVQFIQKVKASLQLQEPYSGGSRFGGLFGPKPNFISAYYDYIDIDVEPMRIIENNNSSNNNSDSTVTTIFHASTPNEEPKPGEDLIGYMMKLVDFGPIDWQQFTSKVSNWTKTDQKHLDKLKFILVDKNNQVNSAVLSNFFKVFNPITTDSSKGYTFPKIIDLIGYPWFHGWISNEEAEATLTKSKDGSFLFRFTPAKPGSYDLMSFHSGKICYWRLQTSKELKLESSTATFDSLGDFEKIHKQSPLKLLREDKSIEGVLLGEGIPNTGK